MKIRNEYAIAVVSKLLMVILGFFESMLLARFLGSELKGQISYINSIAQIGFTIATLGIYTAYPYYRKNEGKESILNKIMSITIGFLVLYLVVFGILSIFLIKIKIEWFYIALVIPIMYYAKVISFVWMIEEPNRRNVVTLVISMIKLLYYVLLFFFINSSLLWGVTTIIITAVLESIYFSVQLEFSFSFAYLRPQYIIPLVKYGFFPMIAVLLTTLNYRIDVIMLNQHSNISYSSIGIYSIGIALAEKVLLVPDAAKEILLSKLAKGKGEEEVAKVMRLCFAIALALSIVISIISRRFVELVYGIEYSGAEIVTNISVWGTIFMVFFKMISQYNVANKKQKYNVIFLSAAIAINIFLNIILIPKMGIDGAAIATSIGYSVSATIFIVYFHRITSIPYSRLVLLSVDDMKQVVHMMKKVK